MGEHTKSFCQVIQYFGPKVNSPCSKMINQTDPKQIGLKKQACLIHFSKDVNVQTQSLTNIT